MHTHQETFDVVARGVLAQGGPGMEDGHVVYLASDGRRCAAGQAMVLGLFRPEVNFNTVLIAADAVPGLFGDHDLWTLRRLQKIHDDVALRREGDAEFFAGWTTAMRSYAADHDLDESVLDSAVGQVTP